MIRKKISPSIASSFLSSVSHPLALARLATTPIRRVSFFTLLPFLIITTTTRLLFHYCLSSPLAVLPSLPSHCVFFSGFFTTTSLSLYFYYFFRLATRCRRPSLPNFFFLLLSNNNNNKKPPTSDIEWNCCPNFRTGEWKNQTKLWNCALRVPAPDKQHNRATHG